MNISQWPEHERPREKLLKQGPQSLSDAELLAVILRVGLPGKTAVQLSMELLNDFGGLRPLLAAKQSQFESRPGLGPAKFAQLQAVLEIARRHLGEALRQGDTLSNPSVTRNYISSKLRDKHQEVFAVMFLDSQHRLIAFEELFYGTIDSASVYPRVVVERALQLHATALIIAHNHPSGLAEPSTADRMLTCRVKDALNLIDIRLLDHFVVGEGSVTSFAERGLL